MIVETCAILWAVVLARTEMFQKVIFEGDAKVYFDALNDAHEFVNWVITSINNNISLSCSSFISCSFS